MFYLLICLLLCSAQHFKVNFRKIGEYFTLLFNSNQKKIQDVQDRTDQIWKFQRYRLIFEYYDSPILPPPLNICAYLMSLLQYFISKKIYKKKLNDSDDSTDTTKGNFSDANIFLRKLYTYLLNK